MAFLFKRNPKTPAELVRALNEHVTKLDYPADAKKAQEEVSRCLQAIKTILSGDNGDAPPQPDLLAQLAHEVYSTDCLYALLQHLDTIEFDSRKNVTLLFTVLLRRKIGDRSPTVDYLIRRPQTVAVLLRGPENPETSLSTGNMLREAIRYEQIARMVLGSAGFWRYFDYCCSDSFEASTDAFSTLSDLLTVHKKAAAEFLSANADRFVDNINRLIVYPNYVTKRESVRLLSQLILTKANYSLMTSYVSSPHNLKLVMILLGDKSKNIQLEAFNIFKVFVANPRKTRAITDILVKNRDKLLEFLPSFNSDHKYDDLFVAEKAFVLEQIEKLPKIVPAGHERGDKIDQEEAGGGLLISSSSQPQQQQQQQLQQQQQPSQVYLNPNLSAQNVYASTKKVLAQGGSGNGGGLSETTSATSPATVIPRQTPLSSSSPEMK